MKNQKIIIEDIRESKNKELSLRVRTHDVINPNSGANSVFAIASNFENKGTVAFTTVPKALEEKLEVGQDLNQFFIENYEKSLEIVVMEATLSTVQGLPENLQTPFKTGEGEWRNKINPENKENITSGGEQVLRYTTVVPSGVLESSFLKSDPTNTVVSTTQAEEVQEQPA